MGDLTKMVPFEDLDGKKRMLRWDFEAAAILEQVLRDAGRAPEETNILAGVEANLDVTTMSGMLYAMLASADYAQGKEEPRLSLRKVRQLMNMENAVACAAIIRRCVSVNNPEAEAPKTPPKKKAGKKTASR
jgi:hypothetical protein